MTITGSRFTGATAVTFGAVAAASFTVNNDSQITAIDPAGAFGTVDAQVATPYGTSPTGAADQFNYVSSKPPVTLLSITPTDYKPTADGTVQRSIETQLQVVFSQPIASLSLSNLSLGLVNNFGSGANDGSPNTDATSALGTPVSTDGGATWIIPIASSSFSYAWGGSGGLPASYSLNDGVYQLTVSGSITPVGGTTQAMDDSGYFTRLFGDITGTGRINTLDAAKFKTAFINTTTINEDFDYNGAATINTLDAARFKAQFSADMVYTGLPSGIE